MAKKLVYSIFFVVAAILVVIFIGSEKKTHEAMQKIVAFCETKDFDSAKLEAAKFLRLSKKFESQNPVFAGDLRKLAVKYLGKGDVSGAVSTYEVAILSVEKGFGPNSVQRAVLLNDLAWAYFKQGDAFHAAEKFKMAMWITSANYNTDPTKENETVLQASLNNANGFYRSLRVVKNQKTKLVSSITLEEEKGIVCEAYDIAFKAFGEKHPYTVSFGTNKDVKGCSKK